MTDAYAAPRPPQAPTLGAGASWRRTSRRSRSIRQCGSRTAKRRPISAGGPGFPRTATASASRGATPCRCPPEIVQGVSHDRASDTVVRRAPVADEERAGVHSRDDECHRVPKRAPQAPGDDIKADQASARSPCERGPRVRIFSIDRTRDRRIDSVPPQTVSTRRPSQCLPSVPCQRECSANANAQPTACDDPGRGDQRDPAEQHQVIQAKCSQTSSAGALPRGRHR